MPGLCNITILKCQKKKKNVSSSLLCNTTLLHHLSIHYSTTVNLILVKLPAFVSTELCIGEYQSFHMEHLHSVKMEQYAFKLSAVGTYST